MKYRVEKSLFGKSIKFVCPKCGAGLTAAISEAGTQDACPDCRTTFIVPGVEDRKQHEAEQQRRRDETAAAKEAKQQQRAEKAAARERQREAAVVTARVVEQSPISTRQAVQSMAQPPQQPAQWQCPYCRGVIPAGVQKCGHCGEWLQRTDHSDAVAGCLGFAMGPIGFFYKGQFAVGVAWFAASFGFFILTAGLGIILAPFLWIAMGIHAASIEGKR